MNIKMLETSELSELCELSRCLAKILRNRDLDFMEI